MDEHEVQCLVVESGVTAAIGHSAVDTVLSEVNFQLIEPGVFRVWLDDRFQVDARSAAVRAELAAISAEQGASTMSPDTVMQAV